MSFLVQRTCQYIISIVIINFHFVTSLLSLTGRDGHYVKTSIKDILIDNKDHTNLLYTCITTLTFHVARKHKGHVNK